MKELSNEEKARTIIGEDCKRENCLQCGGIYSAEKGGCVEYQKIMQMARWKDEQFDKFISSMGLVVKEMYEQYKERRQTPTDNKSTLYLLQDIHPFDWYDPDEDYEDDYKAWKFGLEDAVEEVKGLVSEDGASYRVNRQIIEEFCDKHMSPHTDWTGTRVETKGKCDSVDDFVDKLMEYIEENQHKY